MTATPPCRLPNPSLSTDPEARLVARLQTGEDAAYGELVREYSRRLMATARGFLSCPDECEDAVQDTFVSAFRAVAAFEGSSRLGTWLHRILVNHCLMRLRRAKRAGGVSLEAVGADRFGAAAHPGDGLQRNEMVARVRAEVDRLPTSYGEIIRLRDLEGLDTDATAARLGTSRAVVKTRLHRARAALRLSLAAESLDG
jgi:RNA polymerase sigma-70 factor, ECF subfamily